MVKFRNVECILDFLPLDYEFILGSVSTPESSFYKKLPEYNERQGIVLGGRMITEQILGRKLNQSFETRLSQEIKKSSTL